MDEVSVQGKNNEKKEEVHLTEEQRKAQQEQIERENAKADAEARKIFQNPEELIDTLNQILTRNGKAALPKEKLLQGVSQQNMDNARRYQQRKNEWTALYNQYKLPDSASAFRRIYPLFLKPETEKDAAEYNAQFIRGLGTPEGRREFFFFCLDKLEKADKSLFLNNNLTESMQSAADNPELFDMAWAINSTLTNYILNDPEAADLRANNPGLVETLQDPTLYEAAGTTTILAGAFKDTVTTMFQNLEINDLLTLINISNWKMDGKEHTLMGLVSGPVAQAITYQNDALGAGSREPGAEERAAKEAEVARLLGERHLLEGDLHFTDEDGKKIRRSAGIRALAEGKTVHLQQYDNFHSNKGTEYLLSVKDGQLQSQGNPVEREPEDRKEYDPNLAERARQMEQYEKGRHVYYRDVDGKEITRKAAMQKFADGETIQAVQYDEKCPYLGKVEQIMARPEGEMEIRQMGIGSREIDLTEVAKTPEQQIAALENAMKSLEQTHKTGYIGFLKDSKEFSNAMRTLSETVKLLKDQKNPPSEVDVRIQFTNMKNTIDRYLEVKKEKISRRTDNDWVGLSRMNTLASLKTLLKDSVADGLAAHCRTAAAEKQAGAPEKQVSAPEKKPAGLSAK